VVSQRSLQPLLGCRLGSTTLKSTGQAAQKDRHTGDEEADYLKFEAKQYLKLGQDENSVRIAFGMIKSDLSICPKRIREAPHAYLRWLLKKAPMENITIKKCKEIEHQINVAERRQVEPVFNSELLTVDVLTYEMIEMIAAASKENKISIEVAARSFVPFYGTELSYSSARPQVLDVTRTPRMPRHPLPILRPHATRKKAA
jgi:hypothetical protein